MRIKRQNFFKSEEILKEVREKIDKVDETGQIIDYLTFVPDGEPTLDINLNREIDLLKPLGIKIAVITNASLIWQEDVRTALMKANLVSLKVDSVKAEVWRIINHPHKSLQLPLILEGMIEFAQEYQGELITETMLVKGINDDEKGNIQVSNFLNQLNPVVAYLSIPTRPPAEKWVQAPSEHVLNQIYQIFDKTLNYVQYLVGYEGNEFSLTVDVEEDLLNITAVHPMREEAVKKFLVKAKADWSIIQKLMQKNLIIETEYHEKKYYMRRLQGRESHISSQA